IVEPSGLAEAKALTPIMPEAPARLSTTIGWPSTRAATTHNARIARAPVPPAVQGQMKLIGRPGQSCARRGPAVTASAAAPSAPRMNRRRPLSGVYMYLVSSYRRPCPGSWVCGATAILTQAAGDRPGCACSGGWRPPGVCRSVARTSAKPRHASRTALESLFQERPALRQPARRALHDEPVDG